MPHGPTAESESKRIREELEKLQKKRREIERGEHERHPNGLVKFVKPDRWDYALERMREKVNPF